MRAPVKQPAGVQHAVDRKCGSSWPLNPEAMPALHSSPHCSQIRRPCHVHVQSVTCRLCVWLWPSVRRWLLQKKIPTGFLIQNKPKRWSVTLVSLGRCDLCRASPARFIKTIPIRRFTETHLHYTLWMNLMNHIFSPYEGKTLPLVFS